MSWIAGVMVMLVTLGGCLSRTQVVEQKLDWYEKGFWAGVKRGREQEREECGRPVWISTQGVQPVYMPVPDGRYPIHCLEKGNGGEDW